MAEIQIGVHLTQKSDSLLWSYYLLCFRNKFEGLRSYHSFLTHPNKLQISFSKYGT